MESAAVAGRAVPGHHGVLELETTLGAVEVLEEIRDSASGDRRVARHAAVDQAESPAVVEAAAAAQALVAADGYVGERRPAAIRNPASGVCGRVLQHTGSFQRQIGIHVRPQSAAEGCSTAAERGVANCQPARASDIEEPERDGVGRDAPDRRVRPLDRDVRHDRREPVRAGLSSGLVRCGQRVGRVLETDGVRAFTRRALARARPRGRVRVGRDDRLYERAEPILGVHRRRGAVHMDARERRREVGEDRAAELGDLRRARVVEDEREAATGDRRVEIVRRFLGRNRSAAPASLGPGRSGPVVELEVRLQRAGNRRRVVEARIRSVGGIGADDAQVDEAAAREDRPPSRVDGVRRRRDRCGPRSVRVVRQRRRDAGLARSRRRCRRGGALAGQRDLALRALDLRARDREGQRVGGLAAGVDHADEGRRDVAGGREVGCRDRRRDEGRAHHEGLSRSPVPLQFRASLEARPVHAQRECSAVFRSSGGFETRQLQGQRRDLLLEGADVAAPTRRALLAALVETRDRRRSTCCVVSRVERRAPVEERVRPRGTAVVRERPEHGRGDVAGRDRLIAGLRTAGGKSDEVGAAAERDRIERVVPAVGAGPRVATGEGVSGDDRVAKRHSGSSPDVVDEQAAGLRVAGPPVPCDGRVDQRDRPLGPDPPAAGLPEDVAARVVSADRRVGDGEVGVRADGGGVGDTASAAGGVVRDLALEDCRVPARPEPAAATARMDRRVVDDPGPLDPRLAEHC